MAYLNGKKIVFSPHIHIEGGGGTQPSLFAPVITGGVNTVSWSNNPSNGDYPVTLTATVDGATVTSPLTITQQMDGKTLTVTASATNFQSTSSTILLEYIESGNSLISIGAETAVGDKIEAVCLSFYSADKFDAMYQGVQITSTRISQMITSNGSAANKTVTEQYSLIAKSNQGSISWYLSSGLYTGDWFGFIDTNTAPPLGRGTWSNNLTITITVYDVTSNTTVNTNTYTATNYKINTVFTVNGVFTEGHAYTLLINATLTPKQ